MEPPSASLELKRGRPASPTLPPSPSRSNFLGVLRGPQAPRRPPEPGAATFSSSGFFAIATLLLAHYWLTIANDDGAVPATELGVQRNRVRLTHRITETIRTMEYKKELKDFIVANFLYGDGSSLQDETSFLQSGVIDSTGVLELVFFLESTYKINIHADEIVPRHLDSINNCAEFLASKLKEKSDG